LQTIKKYIFFEKNKYHSSSIYKKNIITNMYAKRIEKTRRGSKYY